MTLFTAIPRITRKASRCTSTKGVTSFHDAGAPFETIDLFKQLAAQGRLTHLHMIPTQTRQFRANRVTTKDAKWLRDMLDKEGKKLGTRVELNDDETLALYW